MAVGSNYPSVQPSLSLDFANGQILDSRISFTRGSTGAYYPGTSVLAEQNLFTYSQNLAQNAPWGANGVTVSGTLITAPDGTTTANQLIYSSGGATQNLRYTFNFQAGVTYTISVYLLAISGDTSFTFDLQNSETSSVYTATASWQRVVYTVTPASARTWVDFQLGATGTIGLWGAQLEQRSSATAYNATTTSALTNYIPQLLTAPINQPRFDHDPVLGTSLGLLIEQSSTNLFTNSNGFGLSIYNWSILNTTPTTYNTNIAPDGTQTATHLTLTNGTSYNANDTSGTYGSFVFTASTTYTWSVYAKAGELSYLMFRNNWTGVNPIFNLATGVVTQGSGTSSMTPVGNGWYRCVCVYAVTSGNNNISFRPYALSGTSNGYDGIYIWGAQLEALAFPTSYIPTTTSTVTRSADSALISGTNFSNWFNPTQGTVYAESTPSLVSANSPLYAFTDSTVTNSNTIYANQYTGNHLVVRIGNSTVVNLTSGTYVDKISTKYAGSYKINNFGVVLNGGTVSTNTSANLPIVDRFFIGGNSSGTTAGVQWIKKISYYQQALTSAQIQTLTSY